MSNEPSGDHASESSARPLKFSRVNAILAVAGVGAIAGGYWLLADGSITVAPLLLVLGYVVLMPLAIIL